MKKKWANKERGLESYGCGKDVYGYDFHVQDGSWALFRGFRIYGSDSNNDHTPICLSLKLDGVRKLKLALEKILAPSPEGDRRKG